MADKRYQVFISSTFTDLKAERQVVYQTLLKMNCIPAGMELFTASDETQMDLIRRVIDTCDYYLLIVAGKYGTQASDGVSFTEKEFDYAVSKGIPVVALLHRDLTQLKGTQIELDKDAREKLEAFRAKVSTDRVVDFWLEGADLAGTTALAIVNAKERFPRVGWVRGGHELTVERVEAVLDLERQNADLRQQVATLSNPPMFDDLAGLDESFTVREQITNKGHQWTGAFSWAEILSHVAYHLETNSAQSYVFSCLGPSLARNFPNCGDIRLDVFDCQKIRIQLEALGLISLAYYDELSWELTPKGRRVLMETQVIRTKVLHTNPGSAQRARQLAGVPEPDEQPK